MAHDELCPVAPPHEILLPYAVPGLLQGGEGRLYQGSALSRDLRTERQAGPLYPEGSLYRFPVFLLFFNEAHDVFFLLVNDMSWVLDPGPSLFSGS